MSSVNCSTGPLFGAPTGAWGKQDEGARDAEPGEHGGAPALGSFVSGEGNRAWNDLDSGCCAEEFAGLVDDVAGIGLDASAVEMAGEPLAWGGRARTRLGFRRGGRWLRI